MKTAASSIKADKKNTDTAPDGEWKPLRTCAACRKKAEKDSFYRVALNKSGLAVLDETGKAEGRGAYVCRDGDCLNKLIKQRGLNRSFKREIGKQVYEALSEKTRADK